MGLLDEYNQILAKKDKILAEIAIELFAELVNATPVKTGNLRNSWVAPQKTKDGYVITNTAIYADIRLTEYRVVRGKQYGSLQFPNGIEGIISKYNSILQTRLNRI